jgi:hypothetical protein
MKSLTVNTSNAISNADLIENSVKEFKVFARKTAENILEMGRIVYETKNKLGTKNKVDFENFCSRIGFNSKSKSIIKLALIGKGYTHLKKQSNHLPNNWTTLYEIARLTEDQFVEFIEDGSIHQFVLGSEVKKLNGSFKEKELLETTSEDNSQEVTEVVPNGTIQGMKFLCEIVKVDDLKVRIKLQKILKSLEEIQVKVEMAPELKSALEPFMNEAA